MFQRTLATTTSVLTLFLGLRPSRLCSSDWMTTQTRDKWLRTSLRIGTVWILGPQNANYFHGKLMLQS